MLTNYPTEMPKEVWTVISDALDGNIGDWPKAVHCAWDAVGFGLGQLVPDQVIVGATVVGNERTEATNAIKQLAAGAKLGIIPWNLILPLLLELLEKLLLKN